jgi:hypothetical protein
MSNKVFNILYAILILLKLFKVSPMNNCWNCNSYNKKTNSLWSYKLKGSTKVVVWLYVLVLKSYKS